METQEELEEMERQFAEREEARRQQRNAEHAAQVAADQARSRERR